MAANQLILLDANVLMEILFGRRKKQAVEQAIVTLPNNSLLTTSILALDIIFYYVEFYKFDKAVAHRFISNYGVLDMNLADYVWAKDNDQGDFEDALQTACALRHGCAKLLTLDKTFAKRHKQHITVQLIE